MAAGWRPLGVFWLALLVVGGGGAVALQVLGPAPVSTSASVAAPPAPAPAAPVVAVVPTPSPPPAPGPPIRPRTLSGASPTPDPALLEPAPDFPDAKLPRTGPDGRTSLLAYARPYDATDRRPRLAMLVVGLGLDMAASHAAIQALPPAVSLGLSPYTHQPDALLDDLRSRGHEFFVTLPMESQGYPLNDGGPHQLISSADPADNARNLEWDLSRMQGEVGVTGASDGLRGERFAASPSAIGVVLHEVARRGLLYVDPRPNVALPGSVGVTSVVDDGGAELEAKLAALEQQARNGGPALGLALRPTPVTVERIAAWARGLDGRGIVLVPVSALAPR